MPQIIINIPDDHTEKLQEIITKRVHDYCWSGDKENHEDVYLSGAGTMDENTPDIWVINVEKKQIA